MTTLFVNIYLFIGLIMCVLLLIGKRNVRLVHEAHMREVSPTLFLALVVTLCFLFWPGVIYQSIKGEKA